ncbi:hypothetical protein IKS38_01810, partial [bacterium]|nr:hypothetical protein [bacterium]
KQSEEENEEEETVGKKKFDWRTELPSLSPVIDDVTLHLPLMGDLPENYIQSPVLRLDLFRRLSMTKTVKELGDLREELTDRFGKLPKSTETLLDLAEIKLRARERGIDTVELSGETLVVRRQGKVYNPFGKFPKIQTKDPKEMAFSILAFLSRIEPLPNFKG